MDDDYLEVSIDRDDKSLTDWWRKSFTLLSECLGVLCHVVYVEQVIETVVFICDQVKHHMAVLLIGIDVMENHKCIRIELSFYRNPCLPVDYVEQSL